ncbi:hypothetical protein Godav_009708 [Gossypium davidsonii]|uniref:RNase H type-1 domain-containing protein n=1 Tax=Gossypium davidsonii TaxID=34287 RepID=A0A7J8SEQ7_GOSDV|nr:hypothetical protein [Gossypium davidsonii]
MIPMDTMIFHSKMRAMMWGLEMSWRFPPRGWLKFNVCGVVFEAKAGGEGVLRDEDGVARALFSGPSEAKDAKLAELNSTGVALELYEEHMGNEMAFALAIAGVKHSDTFKA